MIRTNKNINQREENMNQVQAKESKREKKCADLVHKKYQDTLKDYQGAFDYFEINENERPQNNDYESYDSFFDYVNQSGLSFDFVEAGTFEGQNYGYWRFQMSWGGPSDEFRIYTDYNKNINYIEYWYKDWFDGASIRVHDDVIHNLCENFLECSETPEPHQYEREESDD
tara:strand:+ start:52 stop:561 length:510 start_codon:yes stop_codon:yes gene_type:complete